MITDTTSALCVKYFLELPRANCIASINGIHNRGTIGVICLAAGDHPAHHIGKGSMVPRYPAMISNSYVKEYDRFRIRRIMPAGKNINMGLQNKRPHSRSNNSPKSDVGIAMIEKGEPPPGTKNTIS